jgi:hypothetical protein
MTAEYPAQDALRRARPSQTAAGSPVRTLRVLSVASGLLCAVLFVVAGVGYDLQLYGDGSLFSYGVAAEAAWLFHWRNIADRMFVYLCCHVPAQAYVALTKHAFGGVVVYGTLFFAAPLVGLIATLAADRSPNRSIFVMGCASTALLCPLVFGFPTEVWVSHALFWPALAVCHYARESRGGAILVFVMLLALAMTHEGALIFVAAILATLALRGWSDVRFLRALALVPVVIAIWMVVRAAIQPDDYIARIILRAALHVFDLSYLVCDLVKLLPAVIAAYAVCLCVCLLLRLHNAQLLSVVLVGAALVVYWSVYDHSLHTQSRYYLRTILILGTPAMGFLAALQAIDAESARGFGIPLLPDLAGMLRSAGLARALLGAFVLVMLVHAVETAKFVTAWSHYKQAVKSLAMGTASDPALGDPRFVSAERIDDEANRLGWSSTSPFLSVLLAPKLAPARLVVDPDAGYFWLSCRTARDSADADRAIPAASRRLVRVYSCLHRR